MTARRRELRVILRPDKVGHGEVLDWLNEMERDGRGVSGLQAEVVAALANHVQAARKASEAGSRGGRTDAAPALAQKATRAARGDAEETLRGSDEARCPDPLEMAASRLEF